MPRMEAHLMNNQDKLQKMNLTIVLGENDLIINSIKEAMKQNKVKEAQIISINGILKEGLLVFFSGSKLKSKKVVNAETLRASGFFKLNFDELFGSLNVSVKEGHPLTGGLTRGIAKEGLEIKMTFFK